MPKKSARSSSRVSTKNLAKKLKEALQKNLLLAEEEKTFWLENAEKLPPSVLKAVYREVEKKNKIMESYIREALANDPEHKYLQQLHAKIKEIKRTTLQLAEKSEQVNPEAQLEEELKNL